MAYVGSTNNVNTQGAAAYFNAIKTALLAAGWELMASSDGTNYSATGTPDRVPTVADWNKDSAWCRIREPGGAGGREYVFMRGTGVNSVNGIIKYSRSTGFIGGSPNATTLPTTGTGGDGVVWFATAASVGYGFDASVTTAASSLGIAVTSGYVSCVASNTPLNGVYGWWMIATATGTGALNTIVFTESVQAGTYPTQDADPSYRHVAGGSFYGNSGSSPPSLVQYWQCYGLYAKVAPELYLTSGTYGYVNSINTAQNAATLMIPRTNLGYGPYGATVQTYPVLVGYAGGTYYPKGFSTGFGCYNVGLNQLDTLNLAGAEPRVVVSATYGFCVPWVPNIVPLY